ncbi:MAG: hypothetical protein H0T68_01055 [Gemmatimonadales bacterium]|nr:hypothetical protein [Gemmatimonadales bacterium]
MGPSVDLQVWGGRLCLGLVTLLVSLGYYYGNVRFVPVAVGFAILAGVFYFGRVPSLAASRSVANSGRHRAL